MDSSTDSSESSETSDPGGATASGWFVQQGLRNEATISKPITGIKQVGRENIINVHAGTEPITIRVSSKHKDVEAGAAINIVMPDEVEEIVICIDFHARQDRSRNRNTLGRGLRYSTETFIRALFGRVNMIVNYLRNGSIIIGLQPKTYSAVFDLIKAMDEGIIKELVCGIFENEPGLITEEEWIEPIKIKMDVDIPRGMFPKAFPCKQFESRKELLQELTVSVQREEHGQKDKGPTVSSFPTCQVCQQHFSHRGTNVFLLPCLHGVCETCVTSADRGVIHCRPCERDVNLTETPLQKDEVREKQILHLTVQHHPELVLCTYEEDGNQAVCWCNECDGFLCEHCQMVHSSSRATKKHVVQNVGEMDPGKMDEDQYCSVHPKYIADTWDKDCCMLTCGRCRRGDHVGHEVVDVEEAAEIARKEVSKFGNEIRSTVEQHKSHLVAAEKDLRSLDEKLNTLGEKITFTFTSLNTQVDQRSKELQIALQNHKVNTKDQLSDKKKTSETSYQRCLATSDFIDRTLKYSSPHSILELKPMLEEIFQDCRRSAPTEDYKSLSLPVFNTDGLEIIKTSLAQFGTITTDCSATTNRMQDNGTQTEEDILQELEKLTQEIKQLQLSQKQLMKEKETEKTDSWEETAKLRQEVKQLKIYQDQLNKEKEKMKRDYLEEADNFRQEVKQLKRSQDQLKKEKEKMKRDAWKEEEKARGEIKQLQLSQKQLMKEKETEKTEKTDSWEETAKLRQEVKQLKMSQDQLYKENEKMKRESERAAEKFKQESKKLNAYQEKIIGLEQQIEKIPGWHRLRTLASEETFFLNCTEIYFSMTRYNAETVHINTDGRLVNKPQPNPPHSDQRLKKYWGTSSTVPLPQCGSLQYFEVESQVGIEETLTENTLLLEIGLAREEEQDQSYSIGGQSHSYSLNVLHCPKHSSICRSVCRHGQYINCLSDTLENTPGTSATLHYGVVYDSARSRIAFLDVKNEKIIGKIDSVDSSVALWPMFGVYNQSIATVSMSLVVGGDINMTDKKKALISECLS